MVVGRWNTVDFDSHCKILWGETSAHRYLFMKKNKVQNKNLHNYSHPLQYQAGACWVAGVTVQCSLPFFSMQTLPVTTAFLID